MIHPPILACLAAATAVVLAATPSHAQTASQITPPTFVPPTTALQAPSVDPGGVTTAVPSGADALTVLLGDLAVEGGVVPPPESAALRARLVGHGITVAEIFAAARDLEADLARRGRLLARVVVPAQSLATGATLRLIVVEGAIERVDTGAVPHPVRARVAALLAPLVGRSDVTRGEVERRLLLADDVPGTTLRSTLGAGDRPGSTVLTIAARQRPVTAFVAADNTLPEALGRQSYALGIDVNAVLGAGETIYLRASGIPNTGRGTGFFDATPRNRALAGGVIAPIGTDGLAFNGEYTDARTAPRPAGDAAPGFASRFRRVSARVRYPLVRGRALTIDGEASFDVQDERIRIIAPVVLPLSLDRLRVARVQADLVASLSGGGVATARAAAAFGLDVLGARSSGGAGALLPVSRQGAEAAFRKLEVAGSIDQPIARHLSLVVQGRAQNSFGQVMANAEQFGIARLDGISPLPSGLVLGDAGYVGRAELRAPVAFALGRGTAQVAPYAFGAVGGVRFENPSFLERRSTGVHALGGGVRVAAAGFGGRPGVSASIEYGQAYLPGVTGRTDRFTVSLVIQP